MPIVRRHERPFCDLRHLPGDYRLAAARCGRLFSPEMNGCPGQRSRWPIIFVRFVDEKTMELKLYDTLTREKRAFVPIDPNNVRMYACGPTVYDLAHIGNARPVIVFDVLFRLLRRDYGAEQVTYVRNITDINDK